MLILQLINPEFQLHKSLAPQKSPNSPVNFLVFMKKKGPNHVHTLSSRPPETIAKTLALAAQERSMDPNAKAGSRSVFLAPFGAGEEV